MKRLPLSARSVLLLFTCLDLCSSLFYTSSKENDYPRIGKRPADPGALFDIPRRISIRDILQMDSAFNSLPPNDDFVQPYAKKYSDSLMDSYFNYDDSDLVPKSDNQFIDYLLSMPKLSRRTQKYWRPEE